MDFNFPYQVYLYGRSIERKGELTIYTNPVIFDKVFLSSLEGFFICYEHWLDRDHKLSWKVPRLSFKEDEKGNVAKKFNGQFLSFRK